MLTVGKSLTVNYDDEKETPQLKLLHMMKKKKQVHRQKQEEEKTVEVNEQKKIKAVKTLIKNKEQEK